MKISRLLPPTCFYLCVLLAIGLHFALPLMRLIPSPYKYGGVLLIGVGMWLNLWADALFKRRKTTVKPFEESSALILEGPFRFSRHPMYLGMTLALLGTGIVLGSLGAFAPAIAFPVMMEVAFIGREETQLEQTFGEEYLRYKKHVRRWL